MSTIHDRLGWVRAEAGLSLDAFAGQLAEGGFSVTRQAVFEYEQPPPEGVRRKVPADYVAAVCSSFRVSPWWLLLDVGMPTDPAPNTDAYAKGAADALTLVREASDVAAHRAGLRMTAEGFHLAPPPADVDAR